MISIIFQVQDAQVLSELLISPLSRSTRPSMIFGAYLNAGIDSVDTSVRVAVGGKWLFSLVDFSCEHTILSIYSLFILCLFAEYIHSQVVLRLNKVMFS